MNMQHTRWPLRAVALVALTTAGSMAGHAMAANQPADPAGQPTAIPSWTMAQATGTERVQPGQGASAQALDMRASRLIGMDVHNPQGEDLGDIHDLVVDVNNGRVQYAILGFGGFMGLGEKLFAYPIRSLRAEGERMVLDVPKERLERAPGFERNLWPDWGDASYIDELDRYHGPNVAPQRRQNARLVRGSELIGKDVNDLQGGDAGEIEDLVVNVIDGEVRYVVLDFDKAWSLDDKLLALPLNTLRMPADKDEDAVLQVPRDNLDLSMGFDERNWPALNDAQYRDRIDRYLPIYQPWTHSPNQTMGREPAPPR